jgi:hypothetical protein
MGPTGVCHAASSDQAKVDPDHTVLDIGRNAAIAMVSDIKAQSLIREGKLDEAQRVLDGSYLYELHLLAEFDHALAGDERHMRLRNKVVEQLQREWLRHPPQYLDDASAAYLEKICSTIPSCPRGRVAGQRPLSEVPNP